MKHEKLLMFKKKGDEAQYCFNEEFASKFGAFKSTVEEAPLSIAKTVVTIKEGEKLIAER